jgi:CRP/FNR family transcriptional regulator, cAMP and macrophage regulator
VPRPPASALSHALQLINADERQLDVLIRQAAWAARSAGRGATAPLSASELTTLGGAPRQVAKGGVLFRAGQRASGVWLVRDGRYELLLSSRGRRAVVGELGPGDVDGDISLLLDMPAPYTARATQDGSCLYLPHSDFDRLLGAHPDLARRWMGSAAQRLAGTQHRLAALLGQPLVAQAARLLLDEAVAAIVRLPQRTLAAMLGVRRPSLNKVLKDLEHDGLIVVRYAVIDVVDADGLAELAS